MSKDLNAIVAALIAGNKGKKKASKKKVIDPTKLVVERTQYTGDRKARMLDGMWGEECRVLLLREIDCLGCGLIQTAPNDLLLIRKSHVKHGVHEEMIGIHGMQYEHLPIRMETHVSQVHVCQHCIHLHDDSSGVDHSAQLSFDFGPAIKLIEEKKDEGVSILDDLFDDTSDVPELLPQLGDS
jgi:hypothetical protein